MKENIELEEFAEWVRKQAHRLVVLSMVEHPRSREELTQLACSLCAEAGGIVGRAQMAREQQGVESLDLASMPAPSFAASDPE